MGLELEEEVDAVDQEQQLSHVLATIKTYEAMALTTLVPWLMVSDCFLASCLSANDQ